MRLERRVDMRIGVIGAGSMGGILARHLAKLGHQVSIANSREPGSLTALAAEIGAAPVSVVDVAKAGEIVILAIPTKAVADLPRGLFANVPSSVVVIEVPVPAAAPWVSATRKQTTQRRKAPTAEVVTQHR
jgi:predicted dinucleotide-binding enzyme